MKMPEHPRPEQEEALERALTSLYAVQTPEGFDTAWRASVKKEEHAHMKPFHRAGFWKIAAPAFAALVLAVGSILTGATDLGNQASNEILLRGRGTDDSYSRNEAYEMEFAAPMAEGVMAYDSDEAFPFSPDAIANGAAPEGNDISPEKKIVRTADISLATGAFDAHEADIRRQVEAAGGYVENVSQYEFQDNARIPLRQISFTLRIPTASLDAFLQGVSGIGRVTSRNESATDMTVQYSDTALRLQTQREKMKRLQELLAKADSVTDLLEIESAIAGTQYEIDVYETGLRTIDRQVDNSTVHITLREESPAQSAAEAAVSLGDRIRLGLEASVKGIGQFFQNMLVFLVMALPVLVPLAAVCLVLWLVIRRRRREAA